MTQQNHLISMYQSMLRIRRVEESLAERFQEHEISAALHLCIGQEAVPVGVSVHLDERDLVFSGHRYHGHYLAKGGNLKSLLGEIFHRVNGSFQGHAGSMYALDRRVGFVANSPIVAGSIPMAVGAAWAAKLRGESKIVVAYFGDAALEQGVFFESLNFAALHKLPIVFVCEDNGYAVYTALKDRQPPRIINALANAYGIPCFAGDGNDVLTVFNLAHSAIGSARNGMGPQFMHFETHRWREHCGPHFDDDLGYRSEGELENWLSRCPINMAKQELDNHNLLTEKMVRQFERACQQEFTDAYNAVRESSYCAVNNDSGVSDVA
jgi:TPP-dependent pyruvate/acetoin dehydrogenase alpha subunit